MIYVIGSLRNPKIIDVTKALEVEGYDVFSDWFSAGPQADDFLRDYYKARGFSFKQMLRSPAAKHIFEFDKYHLEKADTAVLVMPAGKSGFLELGWALNGGKRGYILLEGNEERIDIMFQFATGVCDTIEELLHELKGRGSNL